MTDHKKMTISNSGSLCSVYDKAYEQGRADAIEEYSSKLWQVIEKATVNCKLDFTIDDLHNLEIIIKGLVEQLKEQNNNTKSPCCDCKSDMASCCGCSKYFEWKAEQLKGGEDNA